jgi:hypothetical protein
MRTTLSIGYAAILSVLFGGGALAGEAQPGATPKAFAAVDLQHRTIYHSPQTPGYTCWAYASLMPDKSILLGFFQATGPKEGRPRAPMDVQKKLSWPHLSDARRDLTGLKPATSTCDRPTTALPGRN